MDFVRGLLLGAGVLAAIVGFIWIGQGTGILNWPEQSFMVGNQQWAVNGGIAVAVGVIAMFFGRPR